MSRPLRILGENTSLPLAWNEIFKAPLLYRESPVIYACQKAAPADKENIVGLLLNALGRIGSESRPDRGSNEFTLRKDVLGRTRIAFVGFPEDSGPAVSFARGRSKIWAAMSLSDGVGIDVAHPEEFQGNYPMHRAFQLEELNCVYDLTGGCKVKGAALLWSLKEAAAKALGWGFNFIDPLDIRVGSPLPLDEGILFEVKTVHYHPAWARYNGVAWLSIAINH